MEILWSENCDPLLFLLPKIIRGYLRGCEDPSKTFVVTLKQLRGLLHVANASLLTAFTLKRTTEHGYETKIIII